MPDDDDEEGTEDEDVDRHAIRRAMMKALDENPYAAVLYFLQYATGKQRGALPNFTDVWDLHKHRRDNSPEKFLAEAQNLNTVGYQALCLAFDADLGPQKSNLEGVRELSPRYGAATYPLRKHPLFRDGELGTVVGSTGHYLTLRVL